MVISQRTYKPRAERVEEIRKVAQEVASREDLIEKIGLSWGEIKRYARKENISLPPAKNAVGSRRLAERRPYLDSLIEQGCSLGDMAKDPNVSISRQAIHHYIRVSGQHEAWIKEREKIEELQDQVQEEKKSL